MKPLIIEPTDRFLSVSLIAETGKLTFLGRSLPEDGKRLFTPVMEWLHEYEKKPAIQTECTFKMEYFNSSSRKCFVDVFNILDSMREKGNAVTIIWYYEDGDDDLKEMGESYENLYDLDFQFRTY